MCVVWCCLLALCSSAQFGSSSSSSLSSSSSNISWDCDRLEEEAEGYYTLDTEMCEQAREAGSICVGLCDYWEDGYPVSVSFRCTVVGLWLPDDAVCSDGTTDSAGDAELDNAVELVGLAVAFDTEDVDAIEAFAATLLLDMSEASGLDLTEDQILVGTDADGQITVELVGASEEEERLLIAVFLQVWNTDTSTIFDDGYVNFEEAMSITLSVCSDGTFRPDCSVLEVVEEAVKKENFMLTYIIVTVVVFLLIVIALLAYIKLQKDFQDRDYHLHAIDYSSQLVVRAEGEESPSRFMIVG